ncbi:two-component system NarL family response regulator [Kineococcus xinjiangensis]|uniref:Two-component system NarL family response regulator n=1 Tax=Kineococcus xinjiangensis TaxID=512762 RepID=A0A2S6IV62_9ACTN|nr:response regulator transcription factor [Kineococcus xinjiangensis]PPK98079.1 two-component system NarL family response regulator [Kineococcus xinjiangensis]
MSGGGVDGGGPPGTGLRVVIADDHAHTRIGIRSALEADGFQVVGEGASAREALALAAEHHPDACVLDVHMPGGGVAAAGQIVRTLPETVVVMLTYSRDEADLFDALRAGVQGFLLKDMDPDRLGPALRGVLAGEAALPRGLVARVLDEFRNQPRAGLLGRRRRGAQLTSREWEIMGLLQEGLSTEDVAEQLFISTATVRVHVSNVVKKLKAPSREAALGMLAEG